MKKNKRTAKYFRTATRAQSDDVLSDKAWLYSRLSYENPQVMKKQEEQLNQYCIKQGYEVAGKTAVIGNATDEKSILLRLATELKEKGITTMFVSDPSRISLNPDEFIEIVSFFHKNGIHIQYEDGNEDANDLLDVLKQLGYTVTNMEEEPECDEDTMLIQQM